MPCLRNILGENYHENITKEEVLHIINPLGMNGVHYLCSSCSNSTIPCSTSHNPENTSVINRTSATNDGKDSNHTAINLQSSREAGSNTVHNKDHHAEVTTEIANSTWRERSDLCSLFLQGTCPNGISGKHCTNFHPPVCNRYRKNGSHPRYGCTLGNACKLYHPDICTNSMKSRTCYNADCLFKWHLPHTRRAMPNSDRRYRLPQNNWGRNTHKGWHTNNPNYYSRGQHRATQQSGYNSANPALKYSLNRRSQNSKGYHSGVWGDQDAGTGGGIPAKRGDGLGGPQSH